MTTPDLTIEQAEDYAKVASENDIYRVDFAAGVFQQLAATMQRIAELEEIHRQEVDDMIHLHKDACKTEERLREALAYYADPQLYQERIIPDQGTGTPVRCFFIEFDAGERARAALAANLPNANE